MPKTGWVDTYKLSDSDSVEWFLRLGLLTSLDGLNLTIDLNFLEENWWTSGKGFQLKLGSVVQN